MKKILIVFGTRPEAIKMAPVVREFKNLPRQFETKICITAQHRQMLDQVLSFFDISADYDLNLMRANQNLYNLTADIIVGMKEVLEDFKPDYVLVHGDTTTSTGAALAAFYNGSKVCHVEAGLRTNDKYAPFPEEINRQITGRIADIHFAPTQTAKQNLLAEGVNNSYIYVTGNTVIDALQLANQKLINYTDNEIELVKSLIEPHKRLILVTGHRRENFGEGFLNICQALLKIAEREDVQIIYPVHLNPNVQGPVYELLNDNRNIFLIDPLSYPAFVWLMNRAYLIITDSGGIQEEAPSLGKPVIVMRDTTERPEAVTMGTVKLVGTSYIKILKEVDNLLDNSGEYQRMVGLSNPYGDGTAATEIAKVISNM